MQLHYPTSNGHKLWNAKNSLRLFGGCVAHLLAAPFESAFTPHRDLISDYLAFFWKYSVMIVELFSHFLPREGTHTQYILVGSSLEKSDYVIFASIFAVCHTHYLYLQPSFTDLVPSLVQFPLLDQNKNPALCDLVFFFFSRVLFF